MKNFDKDNARLRPNIIGDSIWKPLPEELDPSSWEIPSVKPTKFLDDAEIIDLYMASIDRLNGRIEEYDYLCSGHNDPWVKGEVIPRVARAFQIIMAGEGDFKQDGDLRRYYFEGFDILIRTDMIKD